MNIVNLEDLNNSNCKESSIKKHYPEFYEYLIQTYPTISFKERLYWYYHNINKKPICPICGKEVKFINIFTGYAKFCSKNCANKSTDKISKTKTTCISKYGGVAPACSKEIQDKMRDTYIERYGNDYRDMFSSKSQATHKEKYGGCGNASIVIKEKQINTMLKKYGVKNIMSCEQFKENHISPFTKKAVIEKCLKTKELRYGNPRFTNKEKARRTNIERYGVDWACMRKEARKFSSNSKPNICIEKILTGKNISFGREFPLDGYSYDFIIY